MDKLAKTRIISELKAAIASAMETEHERWVSEKTLREHFELMSPWWLREHKAELGAVQIPGTKGWSYPLNSIQRRFREGTLFK